MPYEFKYSTNLQPEPFKCELECQRCEYFIQKNDTTPVQCKMKVCVGLPYCWRHMRTKLHLRIAKSQIPEAGNGVYAFHPDQTVRKVFKKGDKITLYDGQFINKNTVDERYTNSDQVTAPYVYSIGTSGDNFVDAACKRGVGGMFNFKPYTGKRNPNNVIAKKVQNENKVMLYALRDIQNGEEMFLDYGRNYNVELNNELNETHSTKYVRPRRPSRRRL